MSHTPSEQARTEARALLEIDACEPYPQPKAPSTWLAAAGR